MAESTVAVMIACSRCGRAVDAKPSKDGGAKLPRGWKRHRDAVWCDRCWRDEYVLRSVEMAIAEPIGESWDAIGDRLRRAWRAATAASNVATQALQREDVVRVAEHEKLPPMPKMYRYQEIRQRVPECDPSSVTAIDHAIEGRWRQHRLASLWFRSESAPSYRYPQPHPIVRKAWRMSEGKGGELYFEARIMGQPTTLRLREAGKSGRHDDRYRTRMLRMVMRGDLLAGEASIIGRRRPMGGGSSHRPGVSAASKAPVSPRLRIAVWCPREPLRETSGAMLVRTGGGAMLTWRVGSGHPMTYHAAQAGRWCATHARRVQEMADDLKLEVRKPWQVREALAGMPGAGTRYHDMLAKLDEWSRKHRDRMDSLCHMAAAHVVGHAQRRRVAEIEYDDTDRSYIVDDFPWAKLRLLIEQKAHAKRIAFRSSARVVAPPQESLDVEVGQ